MIESYVGLFFAVGNKNTTIARLRKMLFGAKTEKTAAVCQRPSRDGDSAAHPAGDVPAPDAAAPGTASGEAKGGQATDGRGQGAKPDTGRSADQPAGGVRDCRGEHRCPSIDPEPPGHGRNGADAYTAAEKIEVPHPVASAGRFLPEMRNGNRLRDKPSGRGGAVGRSSPCGR